MLTTKRLLLGLLVLGIVGMHGLATSSGATAAHHGLAAASAALSATTTTGHEHAATSATPATPATPATSATPATPTEDGDESTAALALCMTLLLAVGAATFGGRRTTWVAEMRALVRTHVLPLPPVLRDSTPVPRFTVMRC
jgi:L-gulonolactone oxidase